MNFPLFEQGKVNHVTPSYLLHKTQKLGNEWGEIIKWGAVRVQNVVWASCCVIVCCLARVSAFYWRRQKDFAFSLQRVNDTSIAPSPPPHPLYPLPARSLAVLPLLAYVYNFLKTRILRQCLRNLESKEILGEKGFVGESSGLFLDSCLLH